MLIAQWRDELPLQSMSRDMYLTSHDVTPGNHAEISPDQVHRIERLKQQPLRIEASARSRDQAKAEQKRQQGRRTSARKRRRSSSRSRHK
jgi:hypothetical protein